MADRAIGSHREDHASRADSLRDRTPGGVETKLVVRLEPGAAAPRSITVDAPTPCSCGRKQTPCVTYAPGLICHHVPGGQWS